jgi:hypothetical protein
VGNQFGNQDLVSFDDRLQPTVNRWRRRALCIRFEPTGASLGPPITGPMKDTTDCTPLEAAFSKPTSSFKSPSMKVTRALSLISAGSFAAFRRYNVNVWPSRRAACTNSSPEGPEIRHHQSRTWEADGDIIPVAPRTRICWVIMLCSA